MQSLSTFIRILGPIPEVKDSALIMIMKILLLIQKSPSKVRCSQTSVVSSKYIQGVLRVSVISAIFGYFYSHLSLEIVFPALKLTQNCYIHEYKHIFLLKTGNFILNWVPFLLLQSFYIYLEDYPFQRFSELGISDWENLKSPVRATLKNSKISL